MPIKLKKTRKIILQNNVFVEALERIRFIFDEFDNEVIASCSGGKDSTVILELAYIVAQERGVTLKVFFLDQESERNGTIDYIRNLKNRPWIELIWCQFETRFTQSATFPEQYFTCRDESKKDIRVREKEKSGTITVNDLWNIDFFKIFWLWAKKNYPDKKFAFLWWVRTEESPRRYMGMTQQATYKWITRGKILNKGKHFTFYPIYDRTYIDIWTAIFRNNRTYNVVYDYQYRYWLPVMWMRVSSLVHETSIVNIWYLPEVDKPLYEALCKRLPWVATLNKMKDDIVPKKLPFMFSSRCEYRDYLLDNLIYDDKGKNVLRKAFDTHDRKLQDFKEMKEKIARRHIASILTNDTELTNVKSIDAGWLNKFLKEQGRR